MRCRYLLGALLTACLLAACGTAPLSPPPDAVTAQERQFRWQQHRQQVQQLTHWQLYGKAGLQTEELARSASISWHQEGEQIDITLSGPFGAGATQLTGTATSVKIKVAGQDELPSNNPEQLLYEQTGWKIPVTSLRYWIKGMPAPHDDASFDLDTKGRLSQLQQAQWHLSYPRYQQQNALWLPQKIILRRDQIKLTLVINHWAEMNQPSN